MQTAQSTTPAPVQAETVFNFIDSIGVDTHNNDFDDSYYTLQSQFVAEYQYLGLNLAGGSLDTLSFTGGGGLTYLHILESEMAQGIRFDMAVADTTPIATAIADLNQFETLYPGSIAYVTGANEVAPANLATAEAYQDQLYAAMKADPLLAGVGDIIFSVGSMVPSVISNLGNQSADAGYGNVHSYSTYYPPQIYDSFYVLQNIADTPNDPFVVTETGYPDNPTPGAGLSDAVVAKYQLDNIFDLLLDGASVVEVYELLDQALDPTDTRGSEDHFGFFTANGAPKESAVALHNLTTILNSGNSGNFTAGTLSYSVSGLDSTLNTTAAAAAEGYGIFPLYIASQPVYGASYLLEKSNGDFDIAVWQEPEIWDNTTATPVADSATPVTITLAQTAESVEVFDPLLGTSPIATYTDVSSVTVMVLDHPIIVEVDPFPAGTTAAASTSPVAETVGSGPDALTLFVAETGQPGGAQFTVTVDGLQVGGVQTTSANAANGQAQQFTFYGDFAQGANSIVVSYLNASNSVFSVDSVDINGTYVPGSYSTLSNDGTINSTFTQTTGPAAVSVGFGPNTLDLFLSELNAPAGAQFTIDVDGQQIGGVQTVTASSAANQVQQFAVSGTFSAGSNYVTIDYLNAANSTLSLDSATINGVGISAATLALSNNGDGDLNFSQSGGGPAPVTIGSGSDTLALFVAERGQPGGAAFTITIDGQAYGGIQTTTADASQNQEQEFDLLGNFSIGNHTVAVDYLNSNNSLLIVWAAALDGTAVPNSELVYANSGTLSATFTKPSTAVPQAVPAATSTAPSTPSVPVTTPPVTTPPVTTPPVTTPPVTTPPGSTSTVVIGSGSDTLALSMSERSAPNGAQFTVSVDGTQIGGVQTTNANALAGQAQTFDVEGTFAPGSNSVTINYLNASNSLLFVNSSTIDGAAVANGSLTFSNNGSQSFGFTEQAAAAAATAGSTVLGNGPDTLALTLAERASPGAQFTISVNGQQVGGVQTVTANYLTGQEKQIDLQGTFAQGSHTVSVDYLNASNSLLFVNAATINGQTISGGNLTESNNGTFGFNFSTPAAPAPITIGGSGPDTLALNISEDYYLGNAQFTVSVGGTQIGGVQTASALHGNGQSQVFDIMGNFSGAHNVSVDFLNDAFVVPPGNGTDRNLYVGGATIDGTAIANSALTLYSAGSQSFAFSH